MINITQARFDTLLRQTSFESNGDTYEQKFGSLVTKEFPNCELFWKLFVVPFTEGISNYPKKLSSNINPRKGIDPQIEDIASTNYSAFLNLIYAHIHLESELPSSLENFYMHLGSTCDLVESFLEKFFFLLTQCREEKCESLEYFSREQFIEYAKTWYEENYSNLYDIYLKKGKYVSMQIPSRKNIIKEFFEKYLRRDDLRKQYFSFSQTIRQFRNVVVHDVQVGRLKDANGNIYIPKPKKISEYKTWRQVFAASKNLDVIKRDFCLKKKQMESDITELEKNLNQIWGIVIDEFLLEFYSLDRSKLRNMYLLSLENADNNSLDHDSNDIDSVDNNPAASGTTISNSISVVDKNN